MLTIRDLFAIVLKKSGLEEKNIPAILDFMQKSNSSAKSFFDDMIEDGADLNSIADKLISDLRNAPQGALNAVIDAAKAKGLVDDEFRSKLGRYAAAARSRQSKINRNPSRVDVSSRSLMNMALTLARSVGSADGLRDPDAANKLLQLQVSAGRSESDAFDDLAINGPFYYSLLKWYENGFPVIQMAHTFAAGMVATTLSEESVSMVKPPWSSFLIELPTQLFHTSGSGIEKDWLRLMLISVQALDLNEEEKWFMWTQGEYFSLHRTNLTLKKFVGFEGVEADPLMEDMPMSTKDDRLLIALGMLTANSCLAMSNPSNLSPVSASARKYPSVNSRVSGTPSDPRVFRLGKPLKVDCRQTVADFIDGKRNAPLSIQHLVRGHWKMQACGNGRSDRKAIHIEPYWRGPEDSPINVRPHVLDT